MITSNQEPNTLNWRIGNEGPNIDDGLKMGIYTIGSMPDSAPFLFIKAEYFQFTSKCGVE